MKIPVYNGNQELVVDYTKLEYGLIFFTLKLGEKSLDLNFSEVFDPLMSFKKWLEAISIGVEQCSFTFDDEGTDWKFYFERLTYQRSIFGVTHPYSDAEVHLIDYVDSRQLVKAFYQGFFDFTNSPKFDEKGWAKIMLWERLTENSGFSYDETLKQFLGLNRTELIDALFDAHPIYRLKEPSVGERIISELPEENKGEFVRDDWLIPENYDDFSDEQKRKFVVESLNCPVTNFDGVRIAKFKSQIIEDFLKEK